MQPDECKLFWEMNIMESNYERKNSHQTFNSMINVCNRWNTMIIYMPDILRWANKGPFELTKELVLVLTQDKNKNKRTFMPLSFDKNICIDLVK